MRRDYYALRQAELADSLRELEQAFRELEQAKQKDRKAQMRAENQMKQVARKVVEIEPHLTYLWFWAKKEELEKKGKKEEARRASDIANEIRGGWQKQLTAPTILSSLHFGPGASGINGLPALSFLLHIPFTLQTPYLSKDERDFHLLDNPLRREKVFQTPMAASTSWKGALRAALWQLGYKEDHQVTIRLLGNPRESDEQQAGRLSFFPTFFNQIGLEVINPHDRASGVGARGPILMECVPRGTKGDFFLLYVPFGAIDQSESDRRAEVAEDLQVLCKGVQAMLTIYGFGAKTSSGFGTAAEQLAGTGKLMVRAKLAGEVASSGSAAPQQPDLPRYLESPTRLHADLRHEDGTLKSEAEYQALIESRGRKYGKKDKQLYEKAKGWWDREGQALAQAANRAPTPEPAAPESPPLSEYTFQTFSELCQVAQHVAEQLREGGAS